MNFLVHLKYYSQNYREMIDRNILIAIYDCALRSNHHDRIFR